MPSQQIDPDSELLADVNHDHVRHLLRAFDIMAHRLGHVSNSTALWALASLLAKIMASVNMDPEIMNATGERFSAMLRIAYPAMVRAVEMGQREEEGRPPYDA